MFWRHFRATGQLRTVFWTSFSMLSKDAKLKQIGSCAKCFDATFGRQDSCAESFDANFEQQDRGTQSVGQFLACYQKTANSSKSTVAQSVLTPISSIRTVGHCLLGKFKLFNKSRQIQAKRQLRTVFWRHFRATGQLRTVFWTSFSLLSKDAKFKQIDSCAECFDANFEH